MKTLTFLIGNAAVWCLMLQPASSQEASSAPAAGAPNGASSPANPNPSSGAATDAGNDSNTTSTNDGNVGANNAPNPSPVATGTQPSSSAQPGQTGSMESQRLNSLNQEYQNQQQRELSRDQQRAGQQNSLDGANQGANQFDPSRGVGRGPVFQGDPALNDRGVNQPGLRRRAAPAYRGPRLRGNQPVERGLVIEDLRQLGQPFDDWRVVNHQGRWWYYTPDKAWMYYGDNGWQRHRADNFHREGVGTRRDVSFPVGYPTDDWRLVFHGGRWWFWTPNQTWLYHRNDRWNDFRPRGPVAGHTESAERYGVGYRGPDTASDPRSSTDAPQRSEDRVMNEQGSPVNPALDPLNNPQLPSQTTPDPATNPTTIQDKAIQDNAIQDEAGMNIDAQD